MLLPGTVQQPVASSVTVLLRSRVVGRRWQPRWGDQWPPAMTDQEPVRRRVQDSAPFVFIRNERVAVPGKALLATFLCACVSLREDTLTE